MVLLRDGESQKLDAKWRKSVKKLGYIFLFGVYCQTIFTAGSSNQKLLSFEKFKQNPYQAKSLYYRVKSTQSESHTNNTKVCHPLMDKDVFECSFLPIINTMRKQYAGCRNFSLGQSLAYLTLGAQALNQNECDAKAVFNCDGHIAFSGKFVGEVQHSYCMLQTAMPSSDARKTYTFYLKKIGMHPDQIIKAGQHGNKTAVFEYCSSGRGLISFLHMLYDDLDKSKKNELNKYLKLCVVYSRNQFTNYAAPYIQTVFGCSMQTLCWQDPAFLALTISDVFKDRLVPHYSAKKWCAIDPTKCGPEENVNHVLARLYGHINSLDAKQALTYPNADLLQTFESQSFL